MAHRQATIQRQTSETSIRLSLSLDGSGQHTVETGIGFLDHMLGALAVHGLFDLAVEAKGDLHIDLHHTVEDVAIALGMAFGQALGDRHGIERMGEATVPMDEALARVVVDLSGRPYTVFQADWQTPMIGQLPTSLVPHFFASLATHAGMNCHARVEYGLDDHHRAEALFKALARALRAAVARDPRRTSVASTKGTLTP